MAENWRRDQAAGLMVARTEAIENELAESRRQLPEHSDRVPVTWEGSQFAWHSLAHVNRELGRAIVASRKFDLALVSSEPDEFRPGIASPYGELARHVNRTLSRPAKVHVRHQWPPRFEPPEHGAWVMIQPWEFGGIPGDWIAPMRDVVDEVWVPSTWLRACYVQSGISAEKVFVVPNGVDTDFYTPEGPRFQLGTQKGFKFLFVGGTIRRKGIDTLLDVYTSTFTGQDDVCLVIKGFGSDTVYASSSIHQAVVGLVEKSKTDPRLPAIEYIDGHLSDEDIASLYRACDALVMPYRGEGFGLPIAEAMASGLPVIVTGYGAAMDFCDDGTAYLVKAERVPVRIDVRPNPLGFWWAEPDRQDLARKMRHVFENGIEGKALGGRGRARIVERFQWSHAYARVEQRLLELSKREPVRRVPPSAFHAGVKPILLEGRKRVAFFHHPNWASDSWKRVVTAYVRAFDRRDDVTLVLALDLRQGFPIATISKGLGQLLASMGRTDNDTADLFLSPNDNTLEQIAQLYAAVDWVVPAGDPVQRLRAERMNKQVLEDLSPSAWRAAASGR
jgi:glycosyltransferase involved in cell wall biosynthesis